MFTRQGYRNARQYKMAILSRLEHGEFSGSINSLARDIETSSNLKTTVHHYDETYPVPNEANDYFRAIVDMLAEEDYITLRRDIASYNVHIAITDKGISELRTSNVD